MSTIILIVAYILPSKDGDLARALEDSEIKTRGAVRLGVLAQRAAPLQRNSTPRLEGELQGHLDLAGAADGFVDDADAA